MDIEKIKDLRRVLSRIETDIRNRSGLSTLGISSGEEIIASITFLKGGCKSEVDEVRINKAQAYGIISIISEASKSNYINDIKTLIQYSITEGYILKEDTGIHHDSLESACTDINNEYNNIMEEQL